ncbi:elongation factor EF-2 [Candidatus Parvarchaeota archaeon]|uniref:Elongation factor 2 n=1 Tax=Candidatus Acidifodinimicrobium mancum TaxID=2898728 RepID=A0A8T3UUV9_9ARCH|nr:elongation factor EF-2 [Candidatus Acidifodinimicrobium mancum]MBE5729119.1 elongation factor EF-2 [Candidatus Acidifodinimicrobium mancum]MBE5730034.1 elongation factor EF-2 [Candidatus Acidifodinimicrobium mancum]
MPEKETLSEKVMRLMPQRERIRNIGIIAHIDHGKTTTADTLLAGCGMLSEEKAGKQLYLDSEKIEQERQMTVKSSNVNMVYERAEGDEYLINLIDTPGHVDFGGHVTRAIRAIDGAIVVMDAVEGVMPQTEMVLKQALRDKVKPILYINKIDRLISELRFKPEEMQEHLTKLIIQINSFIRDLAPADVRDKWQVNVQNNTVAFGASRENWALSFKRMQETKLSFKDVYDAYTANNKEKVKELSKKTPVYKVLLEMVVDHLPNPLEAQRYRTPIIWHGDLNSEVGKSLMSCDITGPLMVSITNIEVDPQAGEIAVGRIFSGRLARGQDVFLVNSKQVNKVQQIYIWKGPQKFQVDEATAGNQMGISGLKNVIAGESLSSLQDATPFEPVRHILEPVVVKAIEAKDPKDLPKLVKALRDLSISDVTLKVSINPETGENLIAGLGTLHLEVVEDKLRRTYGVDIVTSQPIVVYKESITTKSGVVEGKSPNKHNKFYIYVEPLPPPIIDLLEAGEININKNKGINMEDRKKLEGAGMDKDAARKVVATYGDNIFMDATKGIIHIGEVIDMCVEAFNEVMKNGPQAKEEVMGVQVVLADTVLHEDAIHRGPAQVIPAVRDAIKEAMMNANPVLLEPIQMIRIDLPMKYVGNVSTLVQSKRGIINEVKEEGDKGVIIAEQPVASTFDFTNELRSATEGRGSWSLAGERFRKLPKELYEQIIKQIRERKGIQNS